MVMEPGDFDRKWQRNKTGLGLWEHRGKVAITGYGYSDLDRRWVDVRVIPKMGRAAVDSNMVFID